MMLATLHLPKRLSRWKELAIASSMCPLQTKDALKPKPPQAWKIVSIGQIHIETKDDLCWCRSGVAALMEVWL